MSLGDSKWKIVTGGGSVRASSQQLARTVVHLDVSPGGAENTLIPIGDPSSIPALLGGLGRLSEVCAFTAQKGQAKYVVPVTPSVAGAFSALVTNSGPGLATIVPTAAPHKAIKIRCFLGGTLGTMSVQFSLDGGTTYGPVIVSAAGWSSTGIRVPGTYCTLTFGAATYVATKTNTIGVDGTVTPGALWVGTVAILSASPIDDYEVQATVITAGALGAAFIQVSLDNGNTTMAPMLVPSGGVVVIPNTGIVLTCSTGPGNFLQGDVYSFLTIGPGFSTTDLNNALTALKAVRTVQASMIHDAAMPVSAAGAFSAAATLDTAILDAFNNGIFDWEACCDCPSSKGGQRITSPLTGFKQLRPLSWRAMEIYGRTDPKDELAAVAVGPLKTFIVAGSTGIAGPGDIVLSASRPIYDSADTDAVITAARGSDLSGRTSVFVGGRDEAAQPGLDNAQINTERTYGGPLAAYLSITAGVIGWKNLTTNAFYVDAGAVRAMNIMIAALRPVAQQLLGQRPQVNPDGTITDIAASGYDTILDGAVKRSMGLVKGGDFTEPQCSFASASVLRSSQLGQNPKRLDIAYNFQPLGEVTDENNIVAASGVLSLTQ